MKKMLYAGMILIAACIISLQANAQCGGPRYIDTVFTGFTLDSVTYSTPYSLKMDIYQPVGDTLSARPLIVLAHGGSFVSGDREDDGTVTSLCADFATKGYVTASIDYRLSNDTALLDSVKTITEVMQTISDAKAAVRFFYKDAYTANLYRVDTSRIFIGGNSAGAVMAMHYAYIDSLGELPAYMQTIIDSNGGIEGNSGNPGYSTKFRAVVNLAGGLHEVSWLGVCSAPVVSAQGSDDPIVPYNCSYAEYGVVPVTLCGLGALQPYISSNTPYWSSLVFPGAGHVPWASSVAAFYEVDTLITNFLYRSMCASVPVLCPAALANSVPDLMEPINISLFPNPANDIVNIRSSQPLSAVSVYDASGRMMRRFNFEDRFDCEINTSGLAGGMYFIRFETGKNCLPVVKKIAIE